MGKKSKRKAQDQPDGAAPSKKVNIQDPQVVTDPEVLKQTILAPFYNRMQSDAHTIVKLQQELEEARTGIQSNHHTIIKLQQELDRARNGDAVEPAGQPSETDLDLDVEKLPQTHPIAAQIRRDLEHAAADETIHLCGSAALEILADRPKDALALAKEKLHTFRYDEVPICWRRLYEEACLYIVVELFDKVAENIFADRIDILPNIIKQLDDAVLVAGAPGRKALIEDVMKQLETTANHRNATKLPDRFTTRAPDAVPFENAVVHTSFVWPIEHFQNHLLKDNMKHPIIISDAFDDWPAMKRWHDPNYLRSLTLGGHRTVPVEIGIHYLDSKWKQELMTFNDFLEKHLMTDNPEEIGYLAQHDIFAQIPALRDDIKIPDYCHATPPPATGAAAETAGLKKVQTLDGPLINAWLGPAGTKTPLHTDPYHNIICQVVGYKYVRLYAPEQTDKLYPFKTTEAGLDMSNTSQVDVSQYAKLIHPELTADMMQKEAQKFPGSDKAEYLQTILGPGECLYIPLGYWHYMESLTISFSVSFWFN